MRTSTPTKASCGSATRSWPAASSPDASCCRARAPIFDHWAGQGVLWLNRTLTYSRWLDDHRPNHTRLWAPFTARAIRVVLEAAHRRGTPIVFALWGTPAQQLQSAIEAEAAALGLPPATVRFARAGHPQLPDKHFRDGNSLATRKRAARGAADPLGLDRIEVLEAGGDQHGRPVRPTEGRSPQAVLPGPDERPLQHGEHLVARLGVDPREEDVLRGEVDPRLVAFPVAAVPFPLKR